MINPERYRNNNNNNNVVVDAQSLPTSVRFSDRKCSNRSHALPSISYYNTNTFIMPYGRARTATFVVVVVVFDPVTRRDFQFESRFRDVSVDFHTVSGRLTLTFRVDITTFIVRHIARLGRR